MSLPTGFSQGQREEAGICEEQEDDVEEVDVEEKD